MKPTMPKRTPTDPAHAEGRGFDRDVLAQVQRWLGHHSASFTLDTYVHLLDNDLGEPLQAAVLLPRPAS
jgi:integrase